MWLNLAKPRELILKTLPQRGFARASFGSQAGATVLRSFWFPSRVQGEIPGSTSLASVVLGFVIWSQHRCALFPEAALPFSLSAQLFSFPWRFPFTHWQAHWWLKTFICLSGTRRECGKSPTRFGLLLTFCFVFIMISVLREGAGWSPEESPLCLPAVGRSLTPIFLYLGCVALRWNVQSQRMKCQGGFGMWKNLSEASGRKPHSAVNLQTCPPRIKRPGNTGIIVLRSPKLAHHNGPATTASSQYLITFFSDFQLSSLSSSLTSKTLEWRDHV